MTDIRVDWDPEAFAGDWLMDPPDLDGRYALVTAVAVSLFTWRTAEDDDRLPDGTTNRRGWWADAEAAEIYPGATPIGSRLWLLYREKQTEQTRQRAEGYIAEALQWMIDLQLCEQVIVDVTWFRPEMLGAEITLVRGTEGSIAVRFERLWDELFPPPEPPSIPKELSAPRSFGGSFAREFA